jgi:hypothetical protein
MAPENKQRQFMVSSPMPENISSQGSLLKTFKYIGKSNWITTRKQATGIVFNPLDELDY